MLSRPDFLKFLLEGPAAVRSVESGSAPAALPGSFAEFGFSDASSAESTSASFALRLLEASGLGDAQHIERAEVILGDNPAARSLPDRVFYWPKAPDRPHQTLLFEIEPVGSELLKDNLFKSLGKQQRLEDAAHRLIQHSQEGFSKGGEKRTAAVKQGSPEETLIVVSIRDDRDSKEDPVNLVFFGTVSAEHSSFETFLISDEARRWATENRPLAEDHLSRLYYRHFSKLATAQWQDAFVTGEERKLARKLLDICTKGSTDAKAIQMGAVKLVQEIAKSFGRGYQSAKLVFDQLPSDHFIGADPKAVEKPGFKNAFEGMTIQDDRERLLGYIIYCLDEKKEADKLRALLAECNSFHNVMVIYPDGDHATLELWQGTRRLQGKLTKAGAQFFGEGEVVNLLSRFFVVSKSEIKSPKDLARELAHRAKYLRLIARGEIEREKALSKSAKRPVLDLYEVFDKALARQTEKEFADAYAQTLTYGLLAARWMARSADKPFTAANVGDLLPSTSPFLVDLFQQLLALRIAPRLRWLIEDLINLLHRTAVNEVFADADRDPVIHFYEDFLDEYDPSIRAERGVYYTPDEVVQYIVRSVHGALVRSFGLPLGLADTTTRSEFAATRGLDVPKGVSGKDAFVQLLDPATGTGTFLKYAVELIHDTMMRQWAGTAWAEAREANVKKHSQQWTDYVHKHLLPRLHGFELMMAPYIVCHLRLGLLLEETGFVFGKGDRLRVFLTNTLEPSTSAQLSMLGEHVAEESSLAERAKKAVAVSVIIGNPPYAGHSSNNGEWARSLVEPYRSINGQPLRLAQGKWLQNDYVKFIAYGEHRIASAGCGVLGYITDHSYLDGDTFPGMRHHLLSTFANVDVINLHGNLTRRETPPDGGVDENVFNILQGVGIVLGVAPPRRSEGLGSLCVADLWGSRKEKLVTLKNADGQSGSLKWKCLSAFDDRYLFVDGQSGTGVDDEFGLFDAIDEAFAPNGRAAPGFLTTHDDYAIAFTKQEIEANVAALVATRTEGEARDRFKLCSQAQWHYQQAKKALAGGAWRKQVVQCLYRPFDVRWTVYNPHVLVHRRERVNAHLCEPGNLALLTTRMTKGDDFSHVFVSDKITEVICLSSKTSANAFVFPLFLRAESALLAGMEERPNIDSSVMKAYQTLAGKSASPRAIFYYWYAILNSPAYRSRYNALLIREFPRVPRPLTKEAFVALSALGKRLVDAHLLEKVAGASRLRGRGDDIVAAGMPKYDEAGSRIWINDEQYFADVGADVWAFRIGSYEVCRKWLSARKGRALTSEECKRFTGVLEALRATISEQESIDKAIDLHGGWPGAFVAKAAGGKK